MKLLKKAIFGLIAVCSITNTTLAQEVNIDNWQKGHRAEGLANIYRIAANQMVVNAENVFPLNYQARDYSLREISSVEKIINHPAVKVALW